MCGLLRADFYSVNLALLNDEELLDEYEEYAQSTQPKGAGNSRDIGRMHLQHDRRAQVIQETITGWLAAKPEGIQLYSFD